jgi:hypothetical protein
MADPFGILGLIGVATQIIQIGVNFGLNRKDAPADAKSFVLELQALISVLSETQKNILDNRDFADTFQGRTSALLSQLADSTTDARLMVTTCQLELAALLKELQTRCQAHRVGWERLKGAFLARQTREAV